MFEKSIVIPFRKTDPNHILAASLRNVPSVSEYDAHILSVHLEKLKMEDAKK